MKKNIKPAVEKIHEKTKNNTPDATSDTDGQTPPETTTTTCESELKKAQADFAEAQDKYIRLYAEFDNYRRRTAQEKINLIQNANEQLINSLLPVVDDFERAEKLSNDTKDLEEGFRLIKNKLCKAIEQFGVKEIDTSIGADFNADIHEAVTKVPTTEKKLKGKLIDVIEKGYKLHGKVIRYAKIVIGE